MGKSAKIHKLKPEQKKFLQWLVDRVANDKNCTIPTRVFERMILFEMYSDEHRDALNELRNVCCTKL